MTFLPITAPGQTGSLTIDSTKDRDLPSIVNTSGVDITVNLQATGQWLLLNKPTNDPNKVIFTKPCDSEGIANLGSDVLKRWAFRSPNNPAGCVLVEVKDAKGVTRAVYGGIKSKPSFSLLQGESASFVINDYSKALHDNSGKIDLKFTTSPARFNPQPPVPGPTPQPITSLYNTGVDNNRSLLGDSVKDPHYELVSFPPETPLPAVTAPNAALSSINWLPNTSTARWISPNATSTYGPIGIYVYRLTFNLPEIVSASVAGSLSVDDNVLDIRVNNVSCGTPIALSTWSSTSRFQLSQFFVSGQNVIDFIVNTIGGPTGLIVDGIAGTYIAKAAGEEVPVIKRVPYNAYPQLPAGLSPTSLVDAGSLLQNATIPIISYKGIDFWPFSYIDNRVSFALVGFKNGQVVKQTEYPGARYAVDIVNDVPSKSVYILGQAAKGVAVPWNLLA